ncbi:MAG: argininosuccinate lyase [Candidatus Dadabacteria bacterium]|nr:argininosuccinate lyase [Candidatus Dadabacteria bacterium]
MAKKAWGGRFASQTHNIAEKFSESVSFDRRLYKEDIRGSIAHVKMLRETGIISRKDASRITEGLQEIEKEIDRGEFAFSESYEDIHLNIEKRLIEKTGSSGAMVHTARSRNDQVLTDTRLYLRGETEEIISLVCALAEQFVELSAKNLGVVIPLYTHMQRAQPVLLSHHLLAYYEMLKRDRERFINCLARVNVSPLGSCAGAGTSFPVDREMTAEDLGFKSVSRNSIDAVSDRDFCAEFVFCCSILMMHLSRLSEELVLWSAKEFDFVDLGDGFTTGSSVMPQKKNPDMSELTRGKTARVYGNLSALLTLMKGLPLSYNRDMQEDKEPLFDTVDTVKLCLRVNVEMLKTLEFKEENMKKALQGGFVTATDVADYLARKGVPFRSAHETVGKIVSYAERGGKELSDLKLSEFRRFSKKIDEDIFQVITFSGSVESRNSLGGTSTSNVRKEIASARRFLKRCM